MATAPAPELSSTLRTVPSQPSAYWPILGDTLSHQDLTPIPAAQGFSSVSPRWTPRHGHITCSGTQTRCRDLEWRSQAQVCVPHVAALLAIQPGLLRSPLCYQP